MQQSRSLGSLTKASLCRTEGLVVTGVSTLVTAGLIEAWKQCFPEVCTLQLIWNPSGGRPSRKGLGHQELPKSMELPASRGFLFSHKSYNPLKYQSSGFSRALGPTIFTKQNGVGSLEEELRCRQDPMLCSIHIWNTADRVNILVIAKPGNDNVVASITVLETKLAGHNSAGN